MFLSFADDDGNQLQKKVDLELTFTESLDPFSAHFATLRIDPNNTVSVPVINRQGGGEASASEVTDAPADEPTANDPGLITAENLLAIYRDHGAQVFSADFSHVAMEYRSLPSGILAYFDPASHSLVLDDDGAGRGWYEDESPLDHSEFAVTAEASWLLQAEESSPISQQFDLLTVVLHELGHAAGLSDYDLSDNPVRLMTANLSPGERRLLSEWDYVGIGGDEEHALFHALEVNGDFSVSDPASNEFGWEITGNVVVEDGRALLGEQVSFNTQLQQGFEKSSDHDFIRFTIHSALLNATENAPGDAFEVALLDAATAESVLPPIPEWNMTSDALLNIQHDGTLSVADGVTLHGVELPDGRYDTREPITVTVDVTGLANGQSADLYFNVLGFGAVDSQVVIDNVCLHPADAGCDNVNPIALNDEVVADGTIVIRSEDLLANDFDFDASDSLTITGVDTILTAGTLVDHQDGTFSYTPPADFTAPDYFTYSISDGRTGYDVATVMIGPNRSPQAVDDAAQTEEGTAVTIPVLDNDSDPEDDALSVTAVGPASNGSAESSEGAVVYTPNNGFVGDDSFTYTISDGTGNTATGTVRVTVTGVDDDPPVVENQGFAVTQGTSLILSSTHLSATDPDSAEAALVFTVKSLPASGQLRRDGEALAVDDTFTQQDILDGKLSYAHDGSSTSSDSMTFTVRDPAGNETGLETLAVTIIEPLSSLGARFDLDGTGSPTASSFVGIGAGLPNAYTVERAYGWQTAIATFDRFGPTDLLRDGHIGSDSTFLADLANGDYFVNVTLGDAVARDAVAVYAEGVLVLDDISTAAGQHAHRSFPVTVDDGQLSLRFEDHGFDPSFTVNAIELRPTQLTHTLTTNPSGTTFSGSGATPGALITVSASSGSIASTTADMHPNYAGIQVLADEAGAFTFDVNQPAAGGTVALRSEEVTGLGLGSATFAYAASLSQRFDLNGTGAPTAAGFVGVGSGTSNAYTATQGYGWETTSATFDRFAPTELLRDGHIGTDNTFQVDVTNGDYVVSVTLGDAVPRDDVAVYAEGVLVLDGVTTAAGRHAHRSFPVAVVDGQLSLRFEDHGFDPHFTVNAIEIVASQATHTLTPNETGTTIVGSGATPGSLITVSTSLGSIAGTIADADVNYAGVQVTAGVDGSFNFAITAPITGGSATISSEEVTGRGIGSTTFAYAGLGPAVQTCDNEEDCFEAPTFTLRTTWGFQSDTRFTVGDGTGDIATWTFTVDPGFEYRVSAYWQSDTKNRATNAPFEVFDGTPVPANLLGTAFVNQRVPTTDVIYTRVLDSGVWFADLGGPYTITGNTLSVTLGDDANDFVVADAIRIERLPALRAETAIVDAAPIDTLTQATAARIVDVGRAAWKAADATAASRLKEVEVVITDLPGNVLGLASEVSNTIWLDTNAAGHSWNILPQSQIPNPKSVDLLTVVSHELGHLLGLPDLDASSHAGHVMAARLPLGERRLPTRGGRVSLSAAEILRPLASGTDSAWGTAVLDPVLRPATRLADDLLRGLGPYLLPTLTAASPDRLGQTHDRALGGPDVASLFGQVRPVVADHRLLSELARRQRIEHGQVDALFDDVDELLDELDADLGRRSAVPGTSQSKSQGRPKEP